MLIFTRRHRKERYLSDEVEAQAALKKWEPRLDAHDTKASDTHGTTTILSMLRELNRTHDDEAHAEKDSDLGAEADCVHSLRSLSLSSP